MSAFRWLAVVGLSIGFAACGGSSKTKDTGGNEPPQLQGIQYPEWVTKGSGAFGGESGRVFYGVGSVAGVRNPAMANAAADNRARAEVTKIFETYSASLMKDYMSTATTGDFSASNEEQYIEQAIKTFSAGTLSGVQIVDHWYHPDGSTVFALARLDLEGFTDNLSKMKDLSNQVRDYVKKNAERVHMDLEKEEEKRGG